MQDGWEVIESKSFVIPNLPPSVNSVYQIIFSQKRVELKPEVRLWKTQAKEYIPKLTPMSSSHLFKVDTIFHYDFFYKNGKLKKFDSQNLMKVLIDAIAEKNGFDDSCVKFGSWESYHAAQDRVDVFISQVASRVTP